MALKKDPQTRIAVRVSEDIKKKFDKLCNDKAINGSALIRQFIIKWIADNEGIQKKEEQTIHKSKN